ncbi:MAG: pilus assembly protein TadG-related protein [Caldilineaceae bacterium]
MRTYFNKQESGQVLIQAAVMIVVLLGFVVLAIDVGNVYAERRRMQNAADAGALAGARELCLLTSKDVAIAKAKEYMTKNGVTTANIGVDDVTVKDNVIQTTARETAKTYFAGFAGYPTLPIVAEAAAACGAATNACGLWPIAFDLSFWTENLKCGEKFVVWNSAPPQNKKEEDDSKISCQIDGKDHPICDCYECNLDGKDGDDFRVITEQSRGWLDYSNVITPPYVDTCTESDSCSASELACRLKSDSNTPISLPACVPGVPGVKASAKDEIKARADKHDAVSIALFDSIGCPSGVTCGGGETYHITKLGCVIAEAWDQNFKLQPKAGFKPPTYTPKTSKVVIVSRDCSGACTSSCGSTDGTPAQPWEMTAVSLTK